MSCLCCQGRSPRYCKLIRLSPPPFVRVCEVNYYYISPLSHPCPRPSLPSPPLLSLPFARSVSFLSFWEDGIGMAKHWCESWLAEPHAWPAALMSSLRFDDVANKRTLLIIWPLAFSVTTTSPPPTRTHFLLIILLHASFSPLSFSGDDLKMRSCFCEHKQGHLSSRAVHPWNDSVQDFTASGEALIVWHLLRNIKNLVRCSNRMSILHADRHIFKKFFEKLCEWKLWDGELLRYLW